MRVFATARSTKSLSRLEAKGIEILPLDVTSVESIAALKAEITKRTGGKLDILFNNAGTSMLTSSLRFFTQAEPGRTRSRVINKLDSVRGSSGRSGYHPRPSNVRHKRLWLV